MSLPLRAPAAACSIVQGLNGWFIGLGDDFLGRSPADSLRPGMVEGWRIMWRGRELAVQVDADFPFSKARVYLAAYSRAQAQPHVEKDGKLCLSSRAVPGDRIRTVQTALAAAFQLLAENETRLHEEDFREDFGLYWLHWADRSDLQVEVMPGPEGARKSILGRAVLTSGRVLVFPGKYAAERCWTNLTGTAPRWLKETPVISIDPLPAPDRYPETADELWEFVAARSQAGTDLLRRLVANNPKEAFVILAGRSSSGREHYAALRISRPVSRLRMLGRRAMREGIKDAEDPARSLFGRFKVERLATQRMDSSSSRLPEGVQRQLAGAKVVIVGCGALGSGVARMLVQTGVEYIYLVDPEKLGWENIRRHELGGGAVGYEKAKSLARSISIALPMIRLVEGYATTFATFAREHPEIVRQADLIVSCTGDWTADASVEHALTQPGHKASAVYGWMEAHALASHAVYLGNTGARLADGFDESGKFRVPVVTGGKPPPPECGGTSSTFGAVELSQAQALVARLATDVLRGLETTPAWHSWLADSVAFEEAEASVASEWAGTRGQPREAGGFYAGEWSFP